MKLLITTPLYPPDIGGPATYAKFLKDTLPKEKFSVEILSFREVLWLPYIIRHIFYFFKVLHRGRSADIIYALDPLGVGLPAGLAAKILQKRFFLRIAGDRAWETAAQKFGITESLDTFSASVAYVFPIRLLKRLQYSSAMLAEKILVPSEYLAKIIANWGVSREKIKVIYNAFEALQEEKTKATAREKLSLFGTVLFSAGRLVPWKGFPALVEIMPEIIHQIPDAKLFIAGSGPEEEKLKNLIRTLHLEKNVCLLGSILQETLFDYISAADVFLLNTFYEGFSHQLLEAMSLGTPIITTTAGGNPELVENDVSGLLVHYNDKTALLRATLCVLKEKEFSETLSVRAKGKIKQFEAKKALAAFMHEIEK